MFCLSIGTGCRVSRTVCLSCNAELTLPAWRAGMKGEHACHSCHAPLLFTFDRHDLITLAIPGARYVMMSALCGRNLVNSVKIYEKLTHKIFSHARACTHYSLAPLLILSLSPPSHVSLFNSLVYHLFYILPLSNTTVLAECCPSSNASIRNPMTL
jgi:hypothetical protein